MSESETDIWTEIKPADRDIDDSRVGGGPDPGETSAVPSPSGSSLRATASDAARTLQFEGLQLGDFLLLRRLGHGGMAEVYLAEQVSLGRKVAVKVLRRDLVADEIHLRRFEQEAKAAGGLNHPNIVQVFVIGAHEGIHYIAQEYVEGVNLRDYLVRHGAPELRTALKFMQQVASALEAAAEAGIVHRDIKPENILITQKGNAKVADFGLAQLSLAGEKLHLTQIGMTMGTPLYMSPEQVNGQPVDQRSDIYSFGVTCYHMLCGDPPFRGETALSVAVQHVNREPAPLTARRPDLPKVVCRVIHRMMAKNPDDRYADAAAVGTDLERIIRTLSERPDEVDRIRISPGRRPATWVGRSLKWMKTHQAATFVMAALVVSSAAAGVGWSVRPPSPLEAPVAASRKVEARSTAARQYYRAMYLVDDEDAWRAVIEYFPDDTVYTPRARAQLALLHLRTNRYDEAKSQYEQLVLLEKDEQSKATGCAGLAVVATLKGQHQESQRLLVDNFRLIRERLEDPDMWRLVRDTLERNRKHLGDRVKQGLEELFDRDPPESGEPQSPRPEPPTQ